MVTIAFEKKVNPAFDSKTSTYIELYNKAIDTKEIPHLVAHYHFIDQTDITDYINDLKTRKDEIQYKAFG